MDPTEAAAYELQDRAALWSIGERRSHDMTIAACDALVAGLDSPALRRLAACTRADADYDVPDHLPVVFRELGLAYHPVDSEGAKEAAARALACRVLAGELLPAEFAFRIHRHFSHELPLTEKVAELDDVYEALEYSDATPGQLDADITAEARRIAAHPRTA